MGKRLRKPAPAFKGLGQFHLLESDKYRRQPRKRVLRVLKRSQVVYSLTAIVPGIKWRLV